jgi:hypothetical protein
VLVVYLPLFPPLVSEIIPFSFSFCGVASLGETSTSLESTFLSPFSNSQVYVCETTKAVAVPSSRAIILGLEVFGRIVAAAGLAGTALQTLDGSSPGIGRRTRTVFEELTGLASELDAHSC